MASRSVCEANCPDSPERHRLPFSELNRRSCSRTSGEMIAVVSSLIIALRVSAVPVIECTEASLLLSQCLTTGQLKRFHRLCFLHLLRLVVAHGLPYVEFRPVQLSSGHFVAGLFTDDISLLLFLTGFQKLLASAIAQIRADTFTAADCRDTVLGARAFRCDLDILFE